MFGICAISIARSLAEIGFSVQGSLVDVLSREFGTVGTCYLIGVVFFVFWKACSGVG